MFTTGAYNARSYRYLKFHIKTTHSFYTSAAAADVEGEFFPFAFPDVFTHTMLL